jgi:hypothetical protein
MRQASFMLAGLLGLGLAAPALAAPDLARVTVEFETTRVNGAVASADVAVTVEGERIVRAELTPTGTTALPLANTGGVFTLEKSFTTEAARAAEFPEGTWRLALDGGAPLELAFARTPVPTPAISAPLPGEVLAPDAVRVAFTACPLCAMPGDTSEAAILDDTAAVVVEELLDPEATRWPDDAEPPLVLDEDAAWRAVIAHTAVRSADLVAGSDAFVFDTVIVEIGVVSFFTGAAPPSGDYCFVVSETPAVLDPLGECVVPMDDAMMVPDDAPLLDPSGTSMTTLAGVDLTLDVQVLAGGAIVGSATADLDGDGSDDASAPLRGKLGGRSGDTSRRLAFALESLAPAAQLSGRLRDRASAGGGGFSGALALRGVLAGAKVRETLPWLEASAPLGWRIDVVLDGRDVTDASLTLENGRTWPLRGRWRFDFVTDLSDVDLRTQGADAGARVRLAGLRIDDPDAVPPLVGAGKLSFKLLGQRGKLRLP